VYIDGYIIDSTIVPDAIKDATCELVVWLIGNSGAISQTQDASYDSIKVGPLVIDFNEQVAGSKYKYFPDIIGYIISGYGTLKEPELPSSRSVKVARLIRA
jgi:hypothetical protein